MSNYLYISGSPDGWRNLAVDEYFLDRMGRDDLLLYFYINENAVIIGRGQNPWAECDLSAMERDNVQLVRRITGGGAVYHDCGNLNYSFIAGEARYDTDRQFGMILSAVRALGIPCSFTGRNDLLADGRKFSGNAFCARRNIHQHHGTLLVRADLDRLKRYLTVDPLKLQAKGVKSVRSRVGNLCDFRPELTVEAFRETLSQAFAAEYGDYTLLTDADIDEAALAPYLEKQRSHEWRLGATPRFDQEIRRRFPWGGVQLLLTLRQSRVDAVQAFSDALDAELPGEIEHLLTGAEYGPRSMADALLRSDNPHIRELAAEIADM